MVETRRRRGRPTREEALAKSKAKLAALDPREILLSIACNPASPATARVAACKALISEETGNPGEPGNGDPVTQLALKLLKGGR